MSNKPNPTIGLYEVYKITTDRLVKAKLRLDAYTYDDAVRLGEVVTLQDNQLFAAIRRYLNLGANELDMLNCIVNIIVPQTENKSKEPEREYAQIARKGFYINGDKYVRFSAGSSQIRHNTITFIRDDLYQPMFEALCCGLKPEDFGDDFSAAKFNAYFGLNMSGIEFLSKPPRVCVVDDYEELTPHLPVDYISCDEWDDYSSGRKKPVIDKQISTMFYDEILNDKGMPIPINSFDGQGLISPEFIHELSNSLGYGYVASNLIVRAPWIKGMLVAFDFKTFCYEHGVTNLTDIFGAEHCINDIDVLLSKSQFKMAKIYAKKGGWRYYCKSMKQYGLQWGVVKPNKERDDDYHPICYQFVNALNLSDDDIPHLVERTEKKLRRLCSSDIAEVYDALVVCDNDDTTSYRSIIQKAVTHNPDLLNDKHIQTLIFNEARAQFTAAKRGKLEVHGHYACMVSDPYAQAQWIIRRHAIDGNKDFEVQGLIQQGYVYSHYWRGAHEVILMRNPLIDRSEVLVRKVAKSESMRRWYKHIKSGIIYSIHGLDPMTQQGADFDGDLTFSSDDRILLKCACRSLNPVAYSLPSTSIVGTIEHSNLIAADMRGLNNKVGQFTNKAARYVAKLPLFDEASPEYTEILKRIKILSGIVGEEIDSVKSGQKPRIPTAWSKKPYLRHQSEKSLSESVYSDEERRRIHEHNMLIADEPPYYFRAVYPHIDRDINTFVSKNAQGAKLIFKKSLNAILSAENLSDNEVEFISKYRRFYPALDSDIAMNKICRYFEGLEMEIQAKISKRQMLREFVYDISLSEYEVSNIAAMTSIYQQQLKFLSSLNRSDDTGTNIARAISNGKKRLQKRQKESLTKLFAGDMKRLVAAMITLARSGVITEAVVWGILDDDVLQIIPKKEVVL